MNRKQIFLMIIIVAAGGFIGGLVQNQLFRIKPVFAESQTDLSKMLEQILGPGAKADVPQPQRKQTLLIKKPSISQKEWQHWAKGLRDIGRFQAVGVGRHLFLVLDTKLGHAWTVMPKSMLYTGRIFPTQQFGERLYSLPTFDTNE